MLSLSQTFKKRSQSFRKFGVFSTTIFLSILLAGGYGIFHDQITFSISPEYFTKYKYGQFGFEPDWFGGDRPTVAVIGFLATWWMGMWIGLLLALVALIYPNHLQMTMGVRNAIAITFYFAIAAAVLGYLYGGFVPSATAAQKLPGNVFDKQAFVIVGCIHTFSYLGGVLGLLAGIYYLLRNYLRLSNEKVQ